MIRFELVYYCIETRSSVLLVTNVCKSKRGLFVSFCGAKVGVESFE